MLLAVNKNGQFEGKFTKRLDFFDFFMTIDIFNFLRQTVAKYVLKNAKLK